MLGIACEMRRLLLLPELEMLGAVFKYLGYSLQLGFKWLGVGN